VSFAVSLITQLKRGTSGRKGVLNEVKGNVTPPPPTPVQMFNDDFGVGLRFSPWGVGGGGGDVTALKLEGGNGEQVHNSVLNLQKTETEQSTLHIGIY
jgi:hypothetical protein